MNEGVLQQVGPPTEVYDTPANLFVARFIGNPPMNTLRGHRRRRRRSRGRRDHPGPDSFRGCCPTEIVVGVRPERLSIGEAGGAGRPGEAAGGRGPRLTSSTWCCDAEDGTTVIARLDPDEVAPAEGDTVTLVADFDHLHLFDPATTERIG